MVVIRSKDPEVAVVPNCLEGIVVKVVSLVLLAQYSVDELLDALADV